ncbi:Ubiquitin-like domain [Dillenia turbinata]|uniref:1-phosphatidylinositol 4-kinase n=1 Tax=Dillenia turbinata TaxID=194707 RepID=A0AAN8W863_9MAGN
MSVADVALSPIREHLPGYVGCRISKCSGELILIYLTVGGSVIPMRVLESDSIASVKLRIQTCKGFTAKNQKLVFGGRELARNNSLVRDYGLSDGNVLHLVLKLSDLLHINVSTACGEELELHVERFRDVGYVKKQIVQSGKCSVDFNDHEVFCNGEKLDDQKLIADLCRNTDAVIHLLVRKSAKVQAKPSDKHVEISVVAESEKTCLEEPQVVTRKLLYEDFLLQPFVAHTKVKLPSYIWDLINSTYEGLAKGKQPMRATEGSGGTYLMQHSSGHKYISIFKPIDEEPMAVNNPQGLPMSPNGEGLKKGTRVGEGAIREVAAYILDHPRSGQRRLTGEKIGFAGVPPTVMVQCLHKGFSFPGGFESSSKNVKIGSLQMFMKNNGSCEDMGPWGFPVDQVHKICVFDIRMANADRHAGNILISKEGNEGKIVLIPIDHGYCLPETFEDCTFDWLYWPQAKQTFSKDTLDYIRSLDAEKDIALLKFYGWDLSMECARTLRTSTMLLKKGAERGLTPFAIGSIVCRETLNKESAIEEIVREAKDSVLPETSEATFLECVSNIMESRLDKLKK